MLKFKYHHDSPPTAITATIYQRAGLGDRGTYVIPTVWAKSATDFQLRFYRRDLGSWVDEGFLCAVSWIAVWN